MSEIYPYCTSCDTELVDDEKDMNEKNENFFYPICEKCLNKHTKRLIELMGDNERR